MHHCNHIKGLLTNLFLRSGRSIYLILLFSFSTNIMGQQLGYVNLDSTHLEGKLYTNLFFSPRRCVILTDSGTFKYRPKQVKDFGYIDGTEYISQEIRIRKKYKRVFIEEMMDDTSKIRLFNYSFILRRRFFIKDSDSIIELSRWKRNDHYYKKEIAKRNSNSFVNPSHGYYNFIGMKSIVQDMHKKRTGFIPHFKVGIVTGGYLNEAQYGSPFPKKLSANNIIVGFAWEYPVINRYLSIYNKMLFSNCALAENKVTEKSSIQWWIQYSYLKVPLSLKVMYPYSFINPYFSAGPVFQKNFFLEAYLSNTKLINETVDVYKTGLKNISTQSIGMNLSVGAEIRMKVPVFIELQWNRIAFKSLLTNEIDLLVGVYLR